VEADHSDAQQRRVDHWYLKESLVVFGPQLDRLLSETTIVFAHGHRIGGGHATETLTYLLHYYAKYFSPFIEMIVVEQGNHSTIHPETLPAHCKYVFLRDESPFSRERCLMAGIGQFDPRRQFFILSDDDIYLETLDIRANLRLCEQYDCVTGFGEIIDLTREDSLRLRHTKTTRGIDITKNVSANRERDGYCLFLKRTAIELQAGPDGGRVFSLPSLRAGQTRVFQSPNQALRLQED
jgi:hypothetical protein